MDSRPLLRNVERFLSTRQQVDNEVLSVLLEKRHAEPMRALCQPPRLVWLNSAQQQAVVTAVRQRGTFLWGPPGTGKTYTLGSLVAVLLGTGKRVLVTTLSNNALDQALVQCREGCVRLFGSTGECRWHRPVARLGLTHDPSLGGLTKVALTDDRFDAPRAGLTWQQHVRASHLVGATFASLAANRFDIGSFDYVVADEVSMASVPDLAVASFFAREGMLLSGDPHQLPPIFPEDADQPNEWFANSIYEHAAVSDPDEDERAVFLDVQYRMHRRIGDLVSKLFSNGKLKTGVSEVEHQALLRDPAVFVHCEGITDALGSDSTPDRENRRYHPAHAELAACIVRQLLQGGVASDQVGVTTPYNAQVVTIRQELKKAHPAGSEVRVATVHSFQGQEREAVIVDITDDGVAPSRLTAKWQLLNVGLSRAKRQLIVIGNDRYLCDPQYFQERDRALWLQMLDHLHLVKASRRPQR